MTPHQLFLRYSFFAVLATLANLSIQRVILWFGNSATLFVIAIVIGALVGLVLKYFLDKHWIFQDISIGKKARSKQFFLYTSAGVFTTTIFWVTETVFWFVWQTDLMREVGAIIGLSFGYIVKYQLDRNYVFISKDTVRAS